MLAQYVGMNCIQAFMQENSFPSQSFPVKMLFVAPHICTRPLPFGLGGWMDGWMDGWWMEYCE